MRKANEGFALPPRQERQPAVSYQAGYNQGWADAMLNMRQYLIGRINGVPYQQVMVHAPQPEVKFQ